MILKEGNKIQYKAPSQCPVCGQELIISKLSCKQCQTSIEGLFSPCKFCRLPKDQLDFIETFIKCRGNIKDVERELNISYPTVRKNLDTVIQSLGYQLERSEEREEEIVLRRKEILSALERGEINSKEAAKKLKEYKR